MKKISVLLLVLSLALSLCACSRASQIPSLAEIAENGAEWGGEQIQQVQGCTLADLEKAWGEADGELPGEYAYFWKVDDTTSVNVYYHKDAEIEHITVTGLEEWLDGIAFVELAPGEEIKSSSKIIVNADDSTIQFVITYARSGLTLKYGIQAEDGTEYSREIVGGNDAYAIEGVPAGTYFLFVRNSGDYSDLPAYKDKSISFNATGAINYHLEDEHMYSEVSPNIPEVEAGTYNLTASDLETTAEEIGQYIFYTNYTQIKVTVQGADSFQGTVMLWDTEYSDNFIQIGEVNERTNTCTFTCCSAARRYQITCDNLDGVALTISEGRTGQLLA